MSVVLFPAEVVVVYVFECGFVVLHCALWLWRECGFCFGVFGSEAKGVRLHLE